MHTISTTNIIIKTVVKKDTPDSPMGIEGVFQKRAHDIEAPAQRAIKLSTLEQRYSRIFLYSRFHTL